MSQGAIDISILGMIYSLGLLIVPLLISISLKLQLTKDILIGTIRMIIQLAVVGVYLGFLFEYNNILLTISYLIIIILITSGSIIQKTNLKLKPMILPIFISIIIPHSLILLYFNFFIVNITNLFDAVYLITIGGMLLGNCLSGNIIALNTYYTNLQKQHNTYLTTLGLGANRNEATLPFLQESIKHSIAPTIATIATIGLVSLPGMMTGQILGGSIPLTAVKYQIAIMLAIFSSRIASNYLIIQLSSRVAFDSYDMLKTEIFKKPLQKTKIKKRLHSLKKDN